MIVEKKSNGFFIMKQIKTQVPDECIYVTSFYTGYKVRSQPEVVIHTADRWPEFKEAIDYDYYKKWTNALQTSQSIKQRDWSEFGFWGHEFKMPPFAHQALAIRFMMHLPASALFMEPGTGKTFSALVATEIRKELGLAKKTLVLCPKSIIYTGWHKDASKFTDLKIFMIRDKKMRWWDPKTRTMARKWKEGRPEFLKQNDCKTLEEKLLYEDADVWVCSIDYFKLHWEEFIGKGFDSMIVDESTMIKSPTSKRFESCRNVGNTCKYRTILTGTPMTNTVMDIWAQMKFLDNSLEDSKATFEQKYFFHPKPDMHHFKKERAGAREHVVKRIHNRCLHIKKQDCLDLPDRVVMRREVEPPAKLKKHYTEMLKDYLTILDSGHEVEATNPLTKLMRLHQILNGYVTDGDKTHYIVPSEKVNEVKLIMEQLPEDEKVIIWAIYKNDFKTLKDALRAYQPAVINGQTRDGDAEDERFLTDPKCRVMLAHPESAKFGKTWNNAKTTIFYTYSYSLEQYLQARDRNYRIGQNSKVTEYILTSGGIEDQIFEAITRKKDLSDLVSRTLIEMAQL